MLEEQLYASLHYGKTVRKGEWNKASFWDLYSVMGYIVLSILAQSTDAHLITCMTASVLPDSERSQHPSCL